MAAKATYDLGPLEGLYRADPFLLSATLPQCATWCLDPGGTPQCCPSRAWRRRFVSNAASSEFSLLSDRLLLRFLSRFFPSSPPFSLSPPSFAAASSDSSNRALRLACVDCLCSCSCSYISPLPFLKFSTHLLPLSLPSIQCASQLFQGPSPPSYHLLHITPTCPFLILQLLSPFPVSLTGRSWHPATLPQSHLISSQSHVGGC